MECKRLIRTKWLVQIHRTTATGMVPRKDPQPKNSKAANSWSAFNLCLCWLQSYDPRRLIKRAPKYSNYTAKILRYEWIHERHLAFLPCKMFLSFLGFWLFCFIFPEWISLRESESITHISESRNRHRMFFQQNIFDNCRVLGYICWNREDTKFNSNIIEQKNYINIYWTRSFLSTY